MPTEHRERNCGGEEVIKRSIDIGVSLVVLVLTLPFFAMIALFIRLETKGPVIFKQERVGLRGTSFLIYKFRSMVEDAASQGPHVTSYNDPRITGVGRVIRKISLDELPQMLNVLSGDMSIVGPRPNVPIQRIEYTEEEWEKRNTVRPGITGLAQAQLRSTATPEERTRLDLEYVDKASIGYDLWVILLTAKQVIFLHGNN